jgi:hypothetical protein
MPRTEVRGGQILDASVTDADFTGQLTVPKGGTGAATLTGILKGNGASAFTAVTAPSGTIVGTTDTQALTNKSIDGALNDIFNATGWTRPVRAVAETSGVGTYTIVGGTVTQISGTSLDGVTVAVTDRVAVVGAPASTGAGVANSTQPGNGIYVVTAIGANITLARAADMSGTVLPWSLFTAVREGTSWGGYVMSWQVGTGAFTWGTTALRHDGYMRFTGNFLGNLVGLTEIQTLTNKRITPRVSTLTNITSVSVNSDSFDYVLDTGITGAITLNNPTGTPTEGQKLWYALTGTASRAISYGTAFEDSSLVRPTTTSGTARLDIGFVWNGATSKWRHVGYC